jgi:hypothetical protein
MTGIKTGWQQVGYRIPTRIRLLAENWKMKIED